MHEYTVELRIEGEMLEPDLVTSEMRLKPSLSRVVGERQGKPSTFSFSKALWVYSASARGVPLDSLDQGLNKIMNRLESRGHHLRRYAREFDVYWWCGHFQSSIDGGPTFSPKLLQRLAEFGVPLRMNTYFSGDH